MKPHLEEAWRALRLADRDIQAFNVLAKESSVHISIVYFHAQQAVEKSLKAVLFSRQIEFRRTHDLLELAQLLTISGIALPLSDEPLYHLNPFAVAFRYDDLEISGVAQNDVADWVIAVRSWAEKQVRQANLSAASD